MNLRKLHADRLGVPEDAGTREIRRAFRRQALARHPDKRGGSPEAIADFQNLHDSYLYLLEHPYRAPAAEPAPRPAPDRARTAETPRPRPAARPKAAYVPWPQRLRSLWLGLAPAQRFGAGAALLIVFCAAGAALWPQDPAPPAGGRVAGGGSAELDHRNFPMSSLLDAERTYKERGAEARAGGAGRACRLTGYENGELRDGAVGAEGSRAECERICDAWLPRTEGGGGRCTWGDVTVRDVAGEEVQRCRLTLRPRSETPKAWLPGEGERATFTTRARCASWCEGEAEKDWNAEMSCGWRTELITERKAVTQEPKRSPPAAPRAATRANRPRR